MAKQAAYGTSLQYIDPDTAGVVVVHYLRDVNGPEMNIETVDVTTHDSPDHFNEFVPGAADGGEIGFELIFDAATSGHSRILELVSERPIVSFVILLPKASGLWRFEGLFTKAGPQFPVKDALSATVTIKVSGKPEYVGVSPDGGPFDFTNGTPWTFLDGTPVTFV